jgi:hypothetical protein
MAAWSLSRAERLAQPDLWPASTNTFVSLLLATQRWDRRKSNNRRVHCCKGTRKSTFSLRQLYLRQ